MNQVNIATIVWEPVKTVQTLFSRVEIVHPHAEIWEGSGDATIFHAEGEMRFK